jgi:hypothetical protein
LGGGGAGPTFRAEQSNTSRHLAEFWMIEPEMAFADLARDIAAAEAYLKHCLTYILQHCNEDLDFFQKQYDSTLKERLQVSPLPPPPSRFMCVQMAGNESCCNAIQTYRGDSIDGDALGSVLKRRDSIRLYEQVSVTDVFL